MKPDNKKTFLSILLISILGFAIYANSLDGKFLWDDRPLILENPYIKNFSRIPKIFTEETGSGAGRKYHHYRPLEILTYMIDYSLWKLDVRGYHLTNTLLHILVALSIGWLIFILYKDTILSLFTSILFVIHPIHTEAVAYISGRIDLLATLFLMLSFIFYIKLLSERKIGFYAVVSVCYILALLSKESSLAFPALLLLYHYTFPSEGEKKKIDVKPFISVLVISFTYLILRGAILKSVTFRESWIATIPQRIPGVFVAITNYIRLLIIPFDLHAAHGGRLFQFTDPRALFGIVVLFLLLAYAFRKRKSSALIFFSIGWFFIALLPVSNIYPVVYYMSEHWLYLPSIGFFIILAKGISFLYRKRGFRVVAIVFLITLSAFYSYLTIRQNDYWKGPMTFYKRTLEYVPDTVSFYTNIGTLYHSMGKDEEALASYEKALEINPNDASAFINIANIYHNRDKKKEAITLYKRTIELEPERVQTYNNLGIAYYESGMRQEAISMFKKAIEIHPNYTEAYTNLANAYYGIGRKEEAIALYKKAIENDPDYYAEGYNNLGSAYLGLGRNEEAIPLFTKAIKIDPGHAKAYSNLANAYYGIGRKEEAIASYKRAIELDPGNAVTHNNLATVYYVEGQYGLAIGHYDRAIEMGYKGDVNFLKMLEPYRK